MPTRPSCNGLPDCPPPVFSTMFYSTASSAVVLSVQDFVVTKYFPVLPGDISIYSSIADSIQPIIGNLAIACLFVYIYVEWARRPRTSPGTQKDGCCEKRAGSGAPFTGPVRSTLSKGWTYGLAIGLLMSVQEPIAFIGGSSFPNGSLIISAFIGILSYVLAGIIIANMLHTPAIGTANCGDAS